MAVTVWSGFLANTHDLGHYLSTTRHTTGGSSHDHLCLGLQVMLHFCCTAALWECCWDAIDVPGVMLHIMIWAQPHQLDGSLGSLAGAEHCTLSSSVITVLYCGGGPSQTSSKGGGEAPSLFSTGG